MVWPPDMVIVHRMYEHTLVQTAADVQLRVMRMEEAFAHGHYATLRHEFRACKDKMANIMNIYSNSLTAGMPSE